MASKVELIKALVDAISTISSLNQEINKLKKENETSNSLIKELNEEIVKLRLRFGLEL